MPKVRLTPRQVELLDEIEQLAIRTLDEFGLTDDGWVVEWERSRRRAGCCDYLRKTVMLSERIFAIEANRDGARDVILHEIAHVLAGPKARHGPIWQKVAVWIGASPERQHSLETPPLRFVGTCACGPRHDRQREPGPTARYTCSACNTRIAWQPREQKS